MVALSLAAVCIFVRCIFRVAELKDGFGGPLANDEITFMILEGTMMVLAATSLTVYNPGRSFQGKWEQMNFSFWQNKKTDVETDLEAKRPTESEE